MNPLPYFDEAKIRAVLSYAELIPAMAEALTALSSGTAQQPPRTIMRLQENGPGSGDEPGWFACMPAVYRDVMGAKLVTFFPGNAGVKRAGRSLPTHMATIYLLDPRTGEPLAVMDGRLITEMRTAAISAVALRTLAALGVKTLAILGSGVQARSHLEALRMVRSFTTVRIASRTQAHAEAFASEIKERGENDLEVVCAPSAEEAVRGADVIVTATSASQPLLRGSWLQRNALAIAVGAVAYDRRELDDEAMQGTVIVESRDTAMRESGDILLSGATIYAELGELLAGTIAHPPEGRIVFKSLGFAVADLAAARLLYRKLVGA